MKVTYNITQNKFNANLNQETTEIKVKFQIGYYPFPVGLENYYTKNETDLLLENYYTKTETYSQTQIDNFVSNLELEIDNKANLSDVYLKTETYNQTEINGFLSGKQNTIGYTPENVSNKSDSYIASSSTTYASTKALVDGLDTKLDKPSLLSSGNLPKWNSTAKNFVGGSIYNADDGKIGISKTNPSEALEVNGNIKATQIKDQYGTLKSQRTITITGNTTLSETHNGTVLNVTNTCNITVPTDLDANFNCVIFAKGAIIVTFVNSGVTIYAPSGLLLKQDKMASLICTSTNNFNLTGELATS